jgi:hypothetical protein
LQYYLLPRRHIFLTLHLLKDFQAPSLWDTYKSAFPVQAGVLNGIGNFDKDAVVGLYELFTKPDEVIVGLGKLLYGAATMPTIQIALQVANRVGGF